MTRAAAEGIVLMLIGLAMLSYLLPFSLARNMLATVFIACALIVIIIMRSITWHQGGTPYDGLLLIGVIVSILYLLSFFAFDRSLLTAVVLVLFAAYYGLMALFVSMYGIRHPHLILHTHMAPEAQGHDFAHDPVFRRGIEPIPEHAPPHHLTHEVHTQQFMRGVKPIAEHAPPHHDQDFMRGVTPVVQHAPPHKRTLLQRVLRRNLPEHDPMEPIHEMQPPQGKAHSAKFTKGIEPIPEVTAEHLHKLGVYSLEPLKKFVITDETAKEKAVVMKDDMTAIPLIKPVKKSRK